MNTDGMTRRRIHLSDGNSIMEYVLPIVLCAVIVFSVVPIIVGQMQQGFSGFFGGERQEGGQLVIRKFGKDPNLMTVQLRLPNGHFIQLHNYPSDLAASVETVGSNGTTEELLANLDALIAQLAAQNDVPEEKLTLLKDLSNRGHALALLQKTLEDAIQQHNGRITLAESEQMMFNVGGETLSLKQIRIRLGICTKVDDAGPVDGVSISSEPEVQHYLDLFPTATEENAELNYVGLDMYEFIKAYGNAKESGLLDDLVLNGVVSSLSSEIAQISEAVQHVSTRIVMNEVEPENLNSNVASELTHQDSAGICTSGRNQDSGIQCQ